MNKVHDFVEAAEVLEKTCGERVQKALAKAVKQAVDTGKRASVTITLHVNPDENDTRRLEVSAAVKAKVPERDVKLCLFGAESGILTMEQEDGLFGGEAAAAAKRLVDSVKPGESLSIGVPGKEPIVIRGGRKQRPSGAKLN